MTQRELVARLKQHIPGAFLKMVKTSGCQPCTGVSCRGVPCTGDG
ncbi:hypothetical protein [Escherichia coli]